MMLPYVTTKEDQADQRGRFGIGLKTLRRISSRLTVHSGPYHFGSGAGVEIRNAEPEAPVPGFFDTRLDTLLVLDLEDFDEGSFEQWFETWSGDSLIFLEFVRSVVWRRDEGLVLAADVMPSEWRPLGSVEALGTAIERRDVRSGKKIWTVLRAHVPVPADQLRAYKRTGATTAISFASCDEEELNGLFVGFRTRIPTRLPFAIDAQFDPTSSRESILEDGWNSWLINCCGKVLAAAGAILLRENPVEAWRFVPLAEDHIGDEGSRWPRELFEVCFAESRAAFAGHAQVSTSAGKLGLDQLSYEEAELTHILDPVDTALLADRPSAVELSARDIGGRWRRVLDILDTSVRIGPGHILDAIDQGSFIEKAPDWWVELAATLVGAMLSNDVHGRLLWLCGDGTPAASAAKGTTNRKLFFGRLDHAFADTHGLYCSLHPAFDSDRGRVAQAWLAAHADFSTRTTNEEVLRAFAEKHVMDPVAIDDPTLMEVKALLDPIGDAQARDIGEALGRAILLEANDGTRRGSTTLVTPPEAYIPKAIDKDSPNWPVAAGGIGELLWLSPTYEDRLRTGLGKAKRRSDGIRPRGAKRFLSLLGAGTSPRLVGAPVGTMPTVSQRRELASLDATEIAEDIWAPDIEKVIDIVTGEIGNHSVKERRQRAVLLLRAMARDWDKFAANVKVPSRKIGRKWIHSRAPVTAQWLARLRERAWVPIGRSGFSTPGQAVLKNGSTEAIYSAAEFVQGIEAGEIPDAMADVLGFVRSVRAVDLVEMLENMRAGEISYDRARVRLAYRHLNELSPRQQWEPIGEMRVASLRTRFNDGGGLVVVETEDGTPMWRRPNQVLRGKRVLPESARYVPEGEAYGKLWRILQIEETRIVDCVDFLKNHADRCTTRERAGELIEVYNFLESLLADADTRQVERVRNVPLACGDGWRTRRPIYLVVRDDLREGLRTALPAMIFWDPPCDPATIPRLVEALGIKLLTPLIKAVPSPRAEEQGEDFTPRFRQAVAHLSDQLARSAAIQRGSLQVSWDEFKNMRLFVYDDKVPVIVSDPDLPRRISLDLKVHASPRPLELHIGADFIGMRGEGGRAIASFFAKPSSWSFDGEWALAWQEAGQREADDLQFVTDAEERRRHAEEEAARIRVSRKGKVLLPGSGHTSSPTPPPVPLPPRKLKNSLVGIGEVTVLPGVPPKAPGEQRKRPIATAPSISSSSSTVSTQANVAYTDAELEDFGWSLVKHVLADAGGPELVDFRRRHHVGADGAFDWTRFVELKASARSMPTSVKMTIIEYARAVEKGRDYILALTCGAEEGFETKVKLIFDPVRMATVSKSESVNVSGLAEAAGIEIVIPDG